MKRILVKLMLAAILLLAASPGSAGDLRIAGRKARADFKAAQVEAMESEERILKDRQALESELEQTGKRIICFKSEIASLQRQSDELQRADEARRQRQSEDRAAISEYTGVVRQAARDLESILVQSHFTALMPDRPDRLAPALAQDRFPGMADLDTISELYIDEIVRSGEVDRHTATLITPDGTETTANILTIGGFCAVYEKDGKAGFLHYGEAGRRFFALSRPLSRLIQRNLKQYLGGQTDAVTFDFSRGGALQQLARRPTLKDKIKKGGPIVWPILAIGLLALIIVLERTLFLNRVHANTDRLMGRVNELAGREDWDGCDAVLRHEEGKPVYNVLRAGLGAVNEKRDTLESVLQEAILKELPRLERLLPALNILGAVAPLLGLLGTVTGMIDTFQVITLHGSGDPRMMSGGISEALVTTMLGLSVAIPIMLAHTFLRRRLEHIVGDMEEKAVALSNIICRECTLVPLIEGPVSATCEWPLKARV